MIKASFLIALAALLTAPAASAEELSYGSDACAADTSNCIRFLGPMSKEELCAAGLSLEGFDLRNDLIDLSELGYAPENIWFSSGSTDDQKHCRGN